MRLLSHRQLFPALWLFLCLAAFSLADNALQANEECDDPSTCLDNLFLDEEPSLSLMQMKANKIKVAAKKGSVKAIPSFEGKGVSLGVPVDPKSSAYMLHSICGTIRESGHIAVFIIGCFSLLAIYTRKRLGKRQDVQQVQVCVDHFVTNSKLSTSKREALKASPMPPLIGQIVDSSPSAALVSALPGLGAELSSMVPSVGSSCPRASREVKSAPLDASFVLPLCETWYAVCVEPMAMCDGSFDILRIAGYPALHGTVRHADGLRVLEITCSGLPTKQGQILASVGIKHAVPAAVAESCALLAEPTSSARESVGGLLDGDVQIPEILDVAGLDGKHYGHIRPDGDGGYFLSAGDEVVMSFAADEGQCLVLRSAEARKEIAQASWFEQSDHFSGAGHLAIRINPNVDTILVLACTLALAIIGGDKNLLRSTRPADRGEE